MEEIIGRKMTRTKPTERRRFCLLASVFVFAMMMFAPLSAFAQGSIFGTVQNADLSVPANGQMTFFGFTNGTDDELRIITSVGAGYDAGNWFDDFQNYLTKAPGNPYDYYFLNTTNNQGFRLSKLIPNNSFQQENILLAPVTWPAQPTGLNLRVVSASTVVVTWTPQPSLTYHVYRQVATSNGSFFRLDNPAGLLTDAGVADSFFVDATVDGVNSYNYLIIAEDGSGSFSQVSAISTVNTSIISAPLLTGITPNNGASSGGATVTISGTGFDIAGSGATIAGSALTGVTVTSPFSLTGVTPAGLIGLADVAMTNTSSGLASNTLVGAYTYQTSNLPPVLAAIGPQAITEGAALNVPVSATDVESIPALSTSALPTGATFVDNLNGTGTLSWTPSFTQAGLFNVTFYATDDSLAVDSEVVVITVTEAGNQLPVLAAIGAQTVAEGVALNVAVSATDAESIPTLTTSALPLGATFLDNADGTGALAWTPTFLQAGVYSVTFYATDVVLAVDSEVVSITVTESGNQLPVLTAIGAQGAAENAIIAFGVSATDAESIPALSTTALPTGALFTDNGDGTGAFTWTPSFVQAGVYGVTFYATDAALAVDSEIVTITVTESGNQLPVLAAIGAQNVIEGLALNVALTATDAESIPVLTTSALPLGATFLDNADGTGSLSWTPSFVQSGSYNITFFATDAALAVDSEIVVVTVTEAGNQLPVLAAIGAQSIAEGAALVVALTATDAEGGLLALTSSALPTGATFLDNGNGTATLNWTPVFTAAGVYSVTFFVTDDSLAIDSEVVAITVTDAGNQLPVLAAIGPQSTTENVLLGFAVSATDAESIPSLTTSILPAGATFTDNADGTGAFSWTPGFTDAGTFNITFFATDGSAAVDSEVVVVTVIDGGNQLPVLALIGSQTTPEGVIVTLPISATDAESIPILTTSLLPAGAIFTDNGDGTGVFDWTPGFSQSGVASITFFATDAALAVDSELITITVAEAGNQTPVLAAIGAKNVFENVNLNFIVVATDGESIPALTTSALPSGASFVDNADGTGAFSWTPSFTDAGVYSVTFTATDDSGSVAIEIISVTVTDVGNQPPVLALIGPQSVVENANLNFGVIATDAESIPALSTSTLPTGATFIDSGNGAGSFDWTPGFADNGVYNITFFATDAGLAIDSEIVVLTVVDAGNQPPVLATLTDQAISEGASLSFLVFGSDPEGIPTLTTSLLPTGATFIDNLDGTGQFDWTPDFIQAGVYSVTFTVTDAALAIDSQTISITVTETGNQGPVITQIADTSIAEGSVLTLVITAVDPDGILPPTLTVTTSLPNSVFVDSGNGVGVLTYSPSFLHAGIGSFTVFATDDGIPSVTTQLSVQVATLESNQPPIIAQVDPVGVLIGRTVSFSVSAVDSTDQNIGNRITMSVANPPQNSSFTDNLDNTGSFSWTPDSLQAGVDTIRFFAVDEGIPPLSSTMDVIITIVPDNIPPVIDSITPSPVTVLEGNTITVRVAASDPDGGFPSLSARDLPENAVFIDSGNGAGALTFTPSFTQGGSGGAAQLYAVAFIAFDGVDNDRKLLLIQVNDAGNQAPVFDVAVDTNVVEGQILDYTIVASDPDGSIPTLTVDSLLPLGASFVDNGDGTGSLTFAPNFVQSGAFIIFLTVDDGFLTTSVSLVITVIDAGNQAPQLPLDTFMVQPVIETELINLTIVATDPDSTIPIISMVPLTPLPAQVTFADNGDGSGTINWLTQNLEAGVYDVLFFATDQFDPALRDSMLIIFTVTDSNVVPILLPDPFVQNQTVDEGQVLQYVIRAFDGDATFATLTMDTLSFVPNLTFVDSGNGVGVMTFAPDFTQGAPNPGSFYVVSFTAVDAIDTTLSDQLNNKQFIVMDINLAPVFDALPSPVTVLEGDTVSFVVQANDPDAATTLTFPIVTGENLPLNASFTNIGGSSNQLQFTFTPDFTQSGSYIVRFIATDGILPETTLVQIDVIEAGNQNPIWLTTLTDTTLIVAGTPLVLPLQATDADLDLLAITSTPTPSGAALIDSGNGAGTFIYNPFPSDTGTTTFMEFYVTDPAGAADTIRTVFQIQGFLRGDSNSDTRVDLTDAVFLIDFIFRSGRFPASPDAADVDFNGKVNVTDISFLINYLFKSGPPPPN